MSGPVCLAAGHDRPDHARRLVGHGDGCDANRLAGEQVSQPRIDRLGFVLCSSDQGSHADDEELAQILVSHLGDPTKPLLATARLLQGGQPQLGGELPA